MNNCNQSIFPSAPVFHETSRSALFYLAAASPIKSNDNILATSLDFAFHILVHYLIKDYLENTQRMVEVSLHQPLVSSFQCLDFSKQEIMLFFE